MDLGDGGGWPKLLEVKRGCPASGHREHQKVLARSAPNEEDGVIPEQTGGPCPASTVIGWLRFTEQTSFLQALKAGHAGLWGANQGSRGMLKWPVDGGWAVLGGKARLSDINRHRSQMASNLPPSLHIFLK